MTRQPRVLIIAGTDSSGGAGVVRDVQVISHFGARASCAITAVTAQTHDHVDAMCMLAPDLVREQMRAALRSGPVGAMKIGMLGSAAIVRTVIGELPERRQVPIVVDTVMSSSSGTALLDSEGVALLRDRLLARSTLATPNLIEAAALLGREAASTVAEQVSQAEELLRFGSEAVLLKGGHASDADAIDVLVTKAEPPTFFRTARVNATLRGTGCGLSSAIAALLATGEPVKSACQRAKARIHEELMLAAAP